MAIPKTIKDAKGSWFGSSKLNQSWLPPEKRIAESASFLHVDTDEHDAFATITYTWHYEGKRHEGTILICTAGKSKAVQIGWVDSWHQNTAVMHLVGSESPDGSFKTKGTYAAGKEVGGWTIEFKLAGEQLTMKMENLTPKDEAEWAVEAVYSQS
jgi:hypothetical protein